VIVFGRELFGFVWASALSFVGGGVLAIMQNFKSYGPMKLFNAFSWKKSNEIIKYSSLTVASTLFGSFMILTDRLFVGYFLHEEQAGIYQGISLISMIFITVLSATKLIVAPMVADYYSQKQQCELNQLFVISTKWPLYICLPALAVVIFAPEIVLGGIFSDIYASGYISLIILGLMHLINIATGPADQVLIMTGKQVDMLRISVAMFIVNIILNIYLIPKIGLTGAALTTLITYGGASIFNVKIVRNKLHLWPYKRTYVKGAVGFLLSGLAVLLVKEIQFQFVALSLVDCSYFMHRFYQCFMVDAI
jgi:O-antigen/teichoic acid export membrane protein